MPITRLQPLNSLGLVLLLCTLSACPEPAAEINNEAKLGGPCLHGVYCEPGLQCVDGLCVTFEEEVLDAGGAQTNMNDNALDASVNNAPPESVLSVCSMYIGTWNIAIESDGEIVCGQNPTTQPYVVSLNNQGELQAQWNTTAGADEYEMTSEFLLIDGKCALKNDSVFIIHAPPMNDIPATDIQVDYHYTVMADDLTLEGSGTMHNSSTIVETGEAQQDCTQDIIISGSIELE